MPEMGELWIAGTSDFGAFLLAAIPGQVLLHTNVVPMQTTSKPLRSRCWVCLTKGLGPATWSNDRCKRTRSRATPSRFSRLQRSSSSTTPSSIPITLVALAHVRELKPSSAAEGFRSFKQCWRPVSSSELSGFAEACPRSLRLFVSAELLAYLACWQRLHPKVVGRNLPGPPPLFYAATKHAQNQRGMQHQGPPVEIWTTQTMLDRYVVAAMVLKCTDLDKFVGLKTT